MVSSTDSDYKSVVLAEDIYFKYNLEDLGDPVGEKNDKEAREGAGDHFLTFFLRFFVGGSGQHGETTHDEHAKEDETGDGHKSGKKTIDDATKAVAGCDANGPIVVAVGDVLGENFANHILSSVVPDDT